MQARGLFVGRNDSNQVLEHTSVSLGYQSRVSRSTDCSFSNDTGCSIRRLVVIGWCTAARSAGPVVDALLSLLHLASRNIPSEQMSSESNDMQA